jgi:hypothetical protein
MDKKATQVFLLLISLIIAGTLPAFSKEIELLSSGSEGVVLKYNVPQFTRDQVWAGNVSYDLIKLTDCPLSNETGKPQLPLKIVILGIPLDGSVKVNILNSSYNDISGLNIPPVPVFQGDGDELNFHLVYNKDENIYSRSDFFPSEIVSIEDPIFIRNQRVVRLKISPIQFNPITLTIRYYASITLKIDFIGKELSAPLEIKEDPFEKIYQNSLLNYQEAKAWRKKRAERILAKPQAVNPFSFSDEWYKIVVKDEGIYQIDKNDLEAAGIDIGKINPKKIRIFSGGGKEVPLNPLTPRPQLQELSILVSGEEDDKFDSQDYILFYGWGVNFWDYDSLTSQYNYFSNHYTTDNIFWLTFKGDFPVSPRRMEEKDGSLVSANFFVPQKFRTRTHWEKDEELYTSSDGYVHDFFNWYEGENNSFTKYLSFSNLVLDETTCIRVKVEPYSNYAQVQVNNQNTTVIINSGDTTAVETNFLLSALNRFDFEFQNEVYFDWYEVDYFKKFQIENNQLFFESPDTSETIEYQIAGASLSSFYLFDIKDRFAVKRIIDFAAQSDTVKFQDQLNEGEKKRYYLASSQKFLHPPSISLDEKSNLRDTSDLNNRADLVIITPFLFYDQLLPYKNFREDFNQIEVKIVKVEDIYDEFSWGLLDPVAIRDFLKYAFDYWQKPPSYVLLVGDGHYDYKGIFASVSSNHIPPFVAYSPVTDDNFIYFGEPGYLGSKSSGEVNMIIGRWPVKSSGDLAAVLSKTISYEQNPNFGNWRNVITLVADDIYAGLGAIDGLWDYHTPDTETLAKKSIPYTFNLNKIYLLDFPFDINGEKPDAENSIIQSFSNSLIINWIGHGNPQVWAHEKVLKRTEDIPKLENAGRYPLVYAATCSNAKFFDPSSESIAEDLLRADNKGAIGVVAATGLVFPGANAELNWAFDSLLLFRGFNLGEALFLAKLKRQPNSNDGAYVIMGDPLTRIGVPESKVAIKNIFPDTMRALTLMSFEGEVEDKTGGLLSDFNGEADILVFDSKKNRSHLVVGNLTWTYDLSGAIIFRGKAKVENGKFSCSFIVPKDISYGGNSGRISVYVHNQSKDGAGAVDSLAVSGSGTSIVDLVGPEIKVGIVGQKNSRNGDFVPSNALLSFEISDSNGINLTKELGHGITLVLDEDWQNQIDLTDSFQYDLDNYTQGHLFYQLSDLPKGEHKFLIKAWDNFNNSSLDSLRVNVYSVSEFELSEVLNYPNPFSDTTFFCYRIKGKAEDVEIKIFTLSGKLIKTIKNASPFSDYNYTTTWDGKDEDGDRVANGVYIYKIVASSEDQNKKAEYYGKAVVIR